MKFIQSFARSRISASHPLSTGSSLGLPPTIRWSYVTTDVIVKILSSMQTLAPNLVYNAKKAMKKRMKKLKKGISTELLSRLKRKLLRP